MRDATFWVFHKTKKYIYIYILYCIPNNSCWISGESFVQPKLQHDWQWCILNCPGNTLVGFFVWVCEPNFVGLTINIYPSICGEYLDIFLHLKGKSPTHERERRLHLYALPRRITHTNKEIHSWVPAAKSTVTRSPLTGTNHRQTSTSHVLKVTSSLIREALRGISSALYLRVSCCNRSTKKIATWQHGERF